LLFIFMRLNRNGENFNDNGEMQTGWAKE